MSSCDDTRQPIENLYDFNKRFERQDRTKVTWGVGAKKTSYREEQQRHPRKNVSVPENLRTEGRLATIHYTQEVGYIKASVDLLEFTEDNVKKRNCILDYLMEYTADTGNPIAFGKRGDVITLEEAIYTDKDCEAYLEDFIEVRKRLLSASDEFLEFLRDIMDNCDDEGDTE